MDYQFHDIDLTSGYTDMPSENPALFTFKSLVASFFNENEVYSSQTLDATLTQLAATAVTRGLSTLNEAIAYCTENVHNKGFLSQNVAQVGYALCMVAGPAQTDKAQEFLALSGLTQEELDKQVSAAFLQVSIAGPQKKIEEVAEGILGAPKDSGDEQGGGEVAVSENGLAKGALEEIGLAEDDSYIGPPPMEESRKEEGVQDPLPESVDVAQREGHAALDSDTLKPAESAIDEDVAPRKDSDLKPVDARRETGRSSFSKRFSFLSRETSISGFIKRIYEKARTKISDFRQARQERSFDSRKVGYQGQAGQLVSTQRQDDSLNSSDIVDTKLLETLQEEFKVGNITSKNVKKFLTAAAKMAQLSRTNPEIASKLEGIFLRSISLPSVQQFIDKNFALQLAKKEAIRAFSQLPHFRRGERKFDSPTPASFALSRIDDQASVSELQRQVMYSSQYLNNGCDVRGYYSRTTTEEEALQAVSIAIDPYPGFGEKLLFQKGKRKQEGKKTSGEQTELDEMPKPGEKCHKGYSLTNQEAFWGTGSSVLVRTKAHVNTTFNTGLDVSKNRWSNWIVPGDISQYREQFVLTWQWPDAEYNPLDRDEELYHEPIAMEMCAVRSSSVQGGAFSQKMDKTAYKKAAVNMFTQEGVLPAQHTKKLHRELSLQDLKGSSISDVKEIVRENVLDLQSANTVIQFLIENAEEGEAGLKLIDEIMKDLQIQPKEGPVQSGEMYFRQIMAATLRNVGLVDAEITDKKYILNMDPPAIFVKGFGNPEEATKLMGRLFALSLRYATLSGDSLKNIGVLSFSAYADTEIIELLQKSLPGVTVIDKALLYNSDLQLQKEIQVGEEIIDLSEMAYVDTANVDSCHSFHNREVVQGSKEPATLATGNGSAILDRLDAMSPERRRERVNPGYTS